MGGVQGGVSTLHPRGNAQAKTEAVGGWQEGDRRRHEEPLGAEEGQGCEGATGRTEGGRRQEGRRKEDGRDFHAGRGENRQLKESDGADCCTPLRPIILNGIQLAQQALTPTLARRVV